MASRKEEAKGNPLSSQKKEKPGYTLAEFVENASVFGTRRECVVAAMRQAGKQEATLEEAKKIVQEYITREVK